MTSLYDNLFAGPTDSQLEKIKIKQQIEKDFMDALYLYRVKQGKDMPEDQALRLYHLIRKKN